MPAYNAARTIEQSLESVRRQTSPPDEILVIDDGSDDGTADCARRHPLGASVISAPHGGQCYAKNIGAANTRSDYIAYLDADDCWHECKLELFRHALRALHQPGMIISDFSRRDFESGGQGQGTNADLWPWIREWPAREIHWHGCRLRILDPAVAVEALLRGYPVYPSALAVRRDLFDRVGGWTGEFARCNDFDLGLRLAATEGLVFIDEPLTVVQQHEGHGALYEYIATQLEWDLEVLKKHGSRRYTGSQHGKMARRYRARRTIYRGDLGMHHRRYADAVAWYLRALAFPREYPRIVERLALTTGAALRHGARKLRFGH
jgi:glycosyltransferase involved in cell wall biosynthesis